MQARFKTKEEFLHYRAEWRKAYKITAANIRSMKADIKHAGKEHDKDAQQALETLRVVARSLMISLDGAKATYAIDKVNRLNSEIRIAQLTMTRLHNRIDPVRSKPLKLSKYKPPESEIQARREAKHGKQAEQQQVMETN